MTQRHKSPDDQSKHIADTRNPGWDNYIPEGHGRTDEQIRMDVHQLLRGEDGSDTTGLSVSVGDGVVTLSGRVDSESEQRRVVELIRSVPSVKDVRDQLKVQHDA